MSIFHPWVKHCAALRPGDTNMLRSSTLKSLDPLSIENERI